MASQCYWPSGDSASDTVPCSNSTFSTCCSRASHCLADGLCLVNSDVNTNQLERGACTDPTWQSPDCPQHCVKRDNGTPYFDQATIHKCEDSIASTQFAEYCCVASFHTPSACCKSSTLRFKVAALAPDKNQIVLTARDSAPMTLVPRGPASTACSTGPMLLGSICVESVPVPTTTPPSDETITSAPNSSTRTTTPPSFASCSLGSALDLDGVCTANPPATVTQPRSTLRCSSGSTLNSNGNCAATSNTIPDTTPSVTTTPTPAEKAATTMTPPTTPPSSISAPISDIPLGSLSSQASLATQITLTTDTKTAALSSSSSQSSLSDSTASSQTLFTSASTGTIATSSSSSSQGSSNNPNLAVKLGVPLAIIGGSVLLTVLVFLGLRKWRGVRTGDNLERQQTEPGVAICNDRTGVFVDAEEPGIFVRGGESGVFVRGGESGIFLNKAYPEYGSSRHTQRRISL